MYYNITTVQSIYCVYDIFKTILKFYNYKMF